jgi:hypothetical protein
MAGPIPSWRGLSIRRSHLGIAAWMIVKGFGRIPKDWLISHSPLPHRAASSGVVVNHLPSKLPTVGRNIPDSTMSSTSSGLTARYKRTHSSSSCRAACRAPCATAAPPPARSSAAFSIPTPSPPTLAGRQRSPRLWLRDYCVFHLSYPAHCDGGVAFPSSQATHGSALAIAR